MSTCYDCVCGKTIDNGVNRGFICDLGEKTFYVPFMAPTPEICDKFAKKSYISVPCITTILHWTADGLQRLRIL